MRKLGLILCVVGFACGDSKDGSGSDDGTGTETTGAETGDTSSDGDDTDGGDDGSGTGDGGSASDGTTGDSADGDTGDATSDDGGTTGGGVINCDRDGWAPSLEEGLFWPMDGYLLGYSEQGMGNMYDSLYMEWFIDFGASNQPGTHTFTDSNYSSCHTCAVIYADCDNQDNCAKQFLAIEGTMETTEIGTVGDTLAATLRDVKMIEVIIDEYTFASTKVAGGEGWCIDEYAIDVTIMPGN